jgi:hypothetical protein
MEYVGMSTNSSERCGVKALTEVGEAPEGTEEELLEVGKVSQTKGSIFGFAADTNAADFKVNG